jgi:hypothetical protein
VVRHCSQIDREENSLGRHYTVFGRSSTSGTSNINCLCDPETVKIARTAANRLTSADAATSVG